MPKPVGFVQPNKDSVPRVLIYVHILLFHLADKCINPKTILKEALAVAYTRMKREKPLLSFRLRSGGGGKESKLS